MVELYLSPDATFAPVIINVSQFDYLTSYDPLSLFRVKRSDGTYFSFAESVLETDYGTVWLIAARPDGVIYEIQGWIRSWSENDNTCFCFDMPKGLTDVAGDVICELVFKVSENWSNPGQIATQNFVIRVEPSPKTIYGNENTIIVPDDKEHPDDPPYIPDDPADKPKYRLVIDKAPNKTSYNEDDTLDLAGLVVMLEKYTDNQGVLERTDVTKSCTYSPASGAKLTANDTTVTASYVQSGSTLTVDFNITIKAAQYRLVVATPPTRTVYTEGDALNLAGLVVNLEKYIDSQILQRTNVTTQCTYEPAEGATLALSDTTIHVTYTR